MARNIHIESELLDRCRTGDNKAFQALVHRLMKPAYFHALALTGNHDDAVDVSQEAFVKAWKSLSTFDTSRSFYPWYYTILKRLSLNMLRSRSRRKETAISFLPDWVEPRSGDTPESRYEDRELAERVNRILNTLPVDDREILVLRDIEGNTYKEIAHILDIPDGTVMSRLYTARNRFRLRMKESGYEYA
jgi:RNA polymerase sigma-70 factor, ECF subfamily